MNFPVRRGYMRCLLLFVCCFVCGLSVTNIFGQMNESDLSVNFKNIPLKQALRWIAKFSKRDVVINEMIQGNITLKLNHLPLQDILDVIFQAYNLGTKQAGKVLYIAPLSKIIEHEKKLNEAEENQPTYVKLIHLNYANANDVATLLRGEKRSLLSAKGSAVVDKRTNCLLVKDSLKKLEILTHFIKQIDVDVPQVLIKAYIVNIDEDYERELGVKFGITSGHHLSGSLNAANQIASGKSVTQVSADERLNINLPSAANDAGRLGLALFKLNRGTLLDLELSALETEGRAKIISNPKLMTANQQSAVIEAGEEVPYQESAAQGVTTTAFKKAVLRLQVTPQITPNNKIILRLKVNQDKSSNKEIKGVPAINTRRISTQVAMNDGQTVVLGGIYERTKSYGVQKTPFFSELPFIGELFKHRKSVDNRRELLIFITPEIIK